MMVQEVMHAEKKFTLEYVKASPDLPDLEYAHDGDVAFDLRNAEEEYILKPMEKKVFSSGIKMSIPPHHVGSIRDRSGMAAKFSVHTMAGVIDPNFRGEIGIVLINLGKEDFKVEKHMRIAQMLIQPVQIVTLKPTATLSETNRGEGGFGSSGYK